MSPALYTHRPITVWPGPMTAHRRRALAGAAKVKAAITSITKDGGPKR